VTKPNGGTFRGWFPDPFSHGAFLTIFFMLIAAAWLVLFAWSLNPDTPLAEFDLHTIPLFFSPLRLASLCRSPASEMSAGTNIAMWGLMSVGMMLPTATPIIGAYFTLASTQPLRIRASNIWGLLGGYVAVWFAFSFGAGLAQWTLARLGLMSIPGLSGYAPLSVALLLVAGLYQFSAIKAACLSRCRSPFGFLISAWRDGFVGAFNMGVRHGLDCLGCCWALMLLAFVGGAMNLIWMGIATGLMALEKLPSIGRPLTKPLGILLIGGTIYAGWIDLTAN